MAIRITTSTEISAEYLNAWLGYKHPRWFKQMEKEAGKKYVEIQKKVFPMKEKTKVSFKVRPNVIIIFKTP